MSLSLEIMPLKCKNLLLSVPFTRKCSSKPPVYDMPKKFKESFYLANASLCDCVNWYVHRAYEVAFPELLDDLMRREPSYSASHAKTKILSIIDVLEPCKMFIDFNFPIKRQFGDYSLVRGIRTHHGLYRKDMVCLGGLRIHPDADEDQVKALATLSTFKYACMGIDMCGSHGAIIINPTTYTEEEKRSILSSYASELIKKNCCGEFTDVIKPDVNATSDEMSWLSAAIPTVENVPKPLLSVGGRHKNDSNYYDYREAISHCVKVGLDLFVNNKNIMEMIQMPPGLTDKTFILEGLGQVGFNSGRTLEKAGAKCVGVKEIDAWNYNPEGINIEELMDYKKEKGSILGFNSKTKPTPSDKIFAEDCDILLLAAGHKTMHCYAANKVKAKIVVEAANGAVTPIAQKTLVEMNKLVVPDIYINCGSALMAHFEFLKNAQQSSLTLTRSATRDLFKDVLTQVKEKAVVVGNTEQVVASRVDIMREPKLLTDAMEYITQQIGREILDNAQKYNLNLDVRTAAYVKAIKNIFNVIYDSKLY